MVAWGLGWSEWSCSSWGWTTYARPACSHVTPNALRLDPDGFPIQHCHLIILYSIVKEAGSGARDMCEWKT